MSSAAAQGISDTPYARRTRELIKLITQLRGVGAQADVDLPRIAVIGNQSAGKSSLVEALSGITVPRDSGTCTRCPMECRLTQAPEEAWSCQVSLRTEYDDESGKRLQNIKEKKFGPSITDPTLLEDVLRRAQLAILNPSVDHGKFVDFNLKKIGSEAPLGSAKQLQFSKNVVCLDLSGPDVTDLSFIDLPGIISNVAPGEDRGNIELIRNLVMDHIQGNCLILLTLTMRDDIENQSAAFFAKQVDPKGRRTIGVLTKPDTLQPGEEQMWLNVLEGRRHMLQHGYYMTKQPGPKELAEKLSWEDARERERKYFEDTSIWAGSSVQSRLGTLNLIKNLSRLLSALIDQTLPKLRIDAKQSRESTRTQLNKLPPPLGDNPSADLLRMVTAFANDFGKFANGASEYAALIQKCKPAYDEFQKAIKATAPDYRPYTLKEKKKYGGFTVRFKDPEDDTDDSSDSGEDDDDDDSESDSFQLADEQEIRSPSEISSTRKVKRKPMYVNEVKEYIHNSLTRELPFNVPFSAKEGLIRESMKAWEDLAMNCFKIIREVVADQLDTLVENHFGRFARSSLLDTVFAIVEKLIEKRQEETVNRIKWLMRLEHRPYTQNHHYLTSFRDKFLSKYRGERRKKSGAPKTGNPAAAGGGGGTDSRAMSPVAGRSASPVPFIQEPVPPNRFGGPQGPPQPNGRPGILRQPSRSNSMPLPPRMDERFMPAQSPQQMQPQMQLPPPMPQQQQQQEQPEQDVSNLIQQLAAAGYPVHNKEDLERLFSGDPYEETLVVMAEVRAYWQVAYKRIIDILPLAIDEDFVCGVSQDMQDMVMEGLGLGGVDANQSAADFLAEEPDVVAERDQLMVKLQRVEDVWEKLSRFKG